MFGLLDELVAYVTSVDAQAREEALSSYPEIDVCLSEKPSFGVAVEVALAEALELADSMGLLVGEKAVGDASVILTRVVEEAFGLLAQDLGVEDAQKYGEGFAWPPDMATVNEELFTRYGRSITACASDLLKKGENLRLSSHRVALLRASDPNPEDPDWVRLEIVAREGVSTFTEDGWSPRQSPRPLRNTYLRVCSAVSMSVLENNNKGYCLTLPLKAALTAIELLHFSLFRHALGFEGALRRWAHD